jgi:hypothetical protein
MIEKLLEKKVKDRDISPEDLFEGDINAILLNLRISAYGPEYECTIFDPTCGKEDNFIVDLGRLSYKEFDLEKYPMDGEYFTYTLPISKHKVKFRLLTHKEEKEIGKTVEELAKYNGGINTLFTSKLKARVMEVSGSNQGKSFIYTDKGQISNYVMKMKSLDALKLTNYINEVEPNLDLNYKFISKVTGKEFHAKIQLTLTKLFYPESSI